MIYSFADGVVMFGARVNETEEILARAESEAEFECWRPSFEVGIVVLNI
jgi:hypothetical protein